MVGPESMMALAGQRQRTGNMITLKRRWGLKSRNQTSLLLIWYEVWEGGEVVHAHVTFDSRLWVGL